MIYHELRNGEHRSFYTDIYQFSENRDIIVAGLGCAGTFCAIAAAEEKADVLGLERGTAPGGMSTQGCVNGYYYGTDGGAFKKADQKCTELCGTVYRPFGTFHPDAKKYVLEQQMLDAGVAFSYHSVIIGVYEEENRICGIRALREGTIQEIGCKVLVDATSDGHVLRICGVKTDIGRASDGGVQPFSSVRIFSLQNGNLGRTNHDSGYINQYDDEAFTYAVIAANASHASSLSLQSGQRFLYLATQIGIREGLRFEGEEKLTLENILNQEPVKKTLLTCYSDIDKHGVDLAFDETIYQEWYMASNLSTVTVSIPVPLGAVVPRGIKGLICTGRCLSSDSYAAAAVRMNRDMYRLGEACGVAAALSLSANGDIMKADYSLLRQKLVERGCYESEDNKLLGFDFPRENIPYSPIQWLTEEDDIQKMLETETPGVAIWSCRKLGKDKIGDRLFDMLASSDQMLRYNAAVALGITGDERALPVLREIVINRSSFHYKDCRRSNQLRSVIAIYLCGKLGDIKIVDELCQILKPEEFDRSLYHEYLEPCYKFSIVNELNSVYFQHFSNAAASLIKIAAKHKNYQNKIYDALYEAIADESYILRMTSENRDSAYYKAAYRIKQFILNSI